MNSELIRIGTLLSAAMAAGGQKCFLCFGTLLFLCRGDKFSLDSDIDVGVIGNPAIALSGFESVLGQCAHKIIDDSTGQPYNAVFSIPNSDVNIDVFFWRKKDGYYWHTYGHQMSSPESGVLSEYEFKGTPAECFDVDAKTIEKYTLDMEYGADRGSSISKHGCWEALVPGAETGGFTLPKPFFYGQALDNWYPDWGTKRPNFGVSEAPQRFTVKSCAGIGWEA